MAKADLHVHTTASDGILTPEEVIDWAAKKGLRAVAITDHDTVKGINRAMEKGKYKNIIVIPGIELSSDHNGKEIHVLGYFIDYKNTHLNKLIKDLSNSRITRGKLIVDKLSKLGINITIDDVSKISSKDFIGRPHIARVLIKKNYVQNIQEAFDKYLSKGKPAYVERYKLSVKQAIDIIHNAGGVAVIAHPGLMENKKNIKDFINFGVDGLEVTHSKHSVDQVKYFKEIVNAYNLIETGGSDCHGVLFNGKPIMGDYYTSYKNVLILKNLSEERYKGGKNE